MPVPAQTAPRVCFRTFELDLVSGELYKDGEKVPLPPRAVEVLRCLVERPGEVVTREDLRARLWAADTFVEFDDSLNHAVKKLRQGLGDSAENPDFIETLPRKGYRFIAPTSAGGATAPAPKPGRRLPVPLLVSALGLLALMVVPLAYDMGGLRGRLLGHETEPAIRSLACFLCRISRRPAAGLFCRRNDDTLITDLAKIRGVKVISRTSVMQLGRQEAAARDRASVGSGGHFGGFGAARWRARANHGTVDPGGHRHPPLG